MYEQVTIDSIEFARSGGHLRGDVATADMKRLQESRGGYSGREVLHYTLSGVVSEKGRPQLVCVVSGALDLVCQRCMEPLAHTLSTRSVLELVNDGEVFMPLEDEDETTDSIPADTAMDVLALIEDEVLLSLPIAPMHDGTACGVASSFRTGKTNPFEVLAVLKKSG